MGSYLPATPQERRDMLDYLGVEEVGALYADLPAEVRVKALRLPEGLSELGALRALEALAAKNRVFPAVFRGAGAYRHYIPAIVKSVTAHETFLTAYTPYQAELSQGILQSIFEYQTMICELTGMDVSNASLYDGASAAAEATAMCRERGRATVAVSAGVHPDTLAAVKTYSHAAGAQVAVLPLRGGLTDCSSLADIQGLSCLLLQQPNYFGLIENGEAAAQAAHAAGAKLIMAVNPIAMALLKSPGECGADIAVGEGQPLGLPLSFGGPYLGFMAATGALVRRLPGRIVGQTADGAGRRAFVLTLQAREQHIRREKASSNVCSNQALCALTAAVYLAAMGPGGLREAAEQCAAKAHYLCEALARAGHARLHTGAFFHEFVTRCDDPAPLLARLEEAGILGGLPVENGVLWCATEMNTKEEIDRLAGIAKEVARL